MAEKGEFSVTLNLVERKLVVEALETQVAVIKRRVNSESNGAIKDILAGHLREAQALAARF